MPYTPKSKAEEARRTKSEPSRRATGFVTEEEGKKPLPELYRADPTMRAIDDFMRRHPSVRKFLPDVATLYSAKSKLTDLLTSRALSEERLYGEGNIPEKKTSIKKKSK
ncbi:MAG: hypothetical protein MN733_03280 [Nitrososphaera sp.]|nr:hypothetical protein [Nitrososphaera sp.]